MSQHPNLKNAPIKESIIQIRVIPDPSLNAEDLNKLVIEEKIRYPKSESQKETILEFFSDRDKHSAGVQDKGIQGYKISSKDRRDIAQFFLDRFSVSRLEPYKDWTTLCSEAKRLWQKYKKNYKPKKISGVSVRYINNFSLPKNMIRFEDYLVSSPKIPENLPQGIGSFYSNIRIPDPDSGAVASVQHIFEGIKKKDDLIQVPIILDVDVFKDTDIEPDSESVWELFESLHIYKNEIFFNSLTEECLELFK